MNEVNFSSLLNNIYWYSAVIIFISIGLWEVLAPARKLSNKIMSRWGVNLSLLLSVYLVVYLFNPILSATSSLVSENLGIGLFNIYKPYVWLEFVIALLAMDLTNYFIHRAFHTYTWTWKFHRVHHSDIEVDLSTGWRFHPFEAIITALAHSVIIAMMGISVYAVIVQLILSRAFNMFTHGNILIPNAVDKVLRLLFITPSLHVVHHSVLREEHDKNYGNIFSFWDRLFGTFYSKPNNRVMTGLTEYRLPEQVAFSNLVLMPFYKHPKASK